MHPCFVRFRVSESGRNRVKRSGERSSRPHHHLPKNPRNTLRFICLNSFFSLHAALLKGCIQLINEQEKADVIERIAEKLNLFIIFFLLTPLGISFPIYIIVDRFFSVPEFIISILMLAFLLIIFLGWINYFFMRLSFSDNKPTSLKGIGRAFLAYTALTCFWITVVLVGIFFIAIYLAGLGI